MWREMGLSGDYVDNGLLLIYIFVDK
jgi:hypothetical protein